MLAGAACTLRSAAVCVPTYDLIRGRGVIFRWLGRRGQPLMNGPFLQSDRREIDCRAGNVFQADQSRLREQGSIVSHPVGNKHCTTTKKRHELIS